MACCWAYAGIKVRDYDRSKWYPHTTVILSLAFQNLTKNNRLKRVLLKTKDVLDFENIYSNTLFCFSKEISKPKALPKQTLVWSKKQLLKRGILKKFCSHKKLLAYFKCFGNLAPKSKWYLKRCFKTFVCALEKN